METNLQIARTFTTDPTDGQAASGESPCEIIKSLHARGSFSELTIRTNLD
jgi:hypothetical protein